MSDDRPLTASPSPAPGSADPAPPPPAGRPVGGTSGGGGSPQRAAAGRAGLVAGGVTGLLWLLTGFVAAILRRFDQAGSLYLPDGMAVFLNGGSSVVDNVFSALGLLVVSAVAAGVVVLAVRGEVRGHGRVALFLSGWFAAVLAGALGTVVQLLRLTLRYPYDGLMETLVPTMLRSSSHWGTTFGWLVGLAVVLAAGSRQRHGTAQREVPSVRA